MKKNTAKCENSCATVATPVVPREPRSWNVNCNKCGATLKLKEDGRVYLCPVCNSKLRIKTGARLVKNLELVNKQLNLALTYNAAQYIAAKAAEQPPKKKCWLVRLFSKKKVAPKVTTLQDIAAQLIAAGYTSEDHFVVDVNENGLFVKKS